MSAYTWGTQVGMMLARRLPYKIRIAFGLLLTLFLLVGLGLSIYKSSLKKSHYKQLKAMADDIFAAEQKYFAKKGDYTADLRLLDFKLPPSSFEVNYSASRYVHDAGEEVLTPETFSFTLENGDSFLVEVIKELNYTEEGKNYSVLEINALPKFRTLPSSYSIRYTYDGYYSAGAGLLKLCDVNILNASKAKRDIQNGGKFCRNLGADPTNHELIWIFPN